MSSFDALLGRILDNGEEVELRGGLNFIGVTITENESLNCLNVNFTGIEAGSNNRIPFCAEGTFAYNASFAFDPIANTLTIPAAMRIVSNSLALIVNAAADVHVACAADGSLPTLRLRSGAASGRIGFYGATPAVKPTVSGSRGGNAALTDLLAELATLGLITDSTTA